MTLIEQMKLRPLEALYIVNKSRRRRTNPANAVAAVLGYLIADGYLIPDPDYSGFQISPQSCGSQFPLQKYEHDVLEGIVVEPILRTHSILMDLEMKQMLAKRGVLELRKITGISALDKLIGMYSLTIGHYLAANELDAIKHAYLESGPEEIENIFPGMIYAFPDLVGSDLLVRRSKAVLFNHYTAPVPPMPK